MLSMGKGRAGRCVPFVAFLPDVLYNDPIKEKKELTIMPQYDPCKYTYSSRRNVVYAKNGMACTSVPLGAQVGLEVLKAGGNAMDAAVAR